MQLSEIFSQLTYGELSQVSLGGAEAGAIDKANYPQVLAHINLGLTALYKRFSLKEGRVTFLLQEGKTSYKLDTNEDVRFVQMGFDDEFLNDIHKIEKVLTDTGWALGLNDDTDAYACFTPSVISLRVPAAIANQSVDLPAHLKTSNLTVVYRANHPKVGFGRGVFDPDRVTVELPVSHLEPLLLFVASRVHNPIGMTNEFHAGNSYYAKYEASCQEIERLNLQVDQNSQNTRLRANGWI